MVYGSYRVSERQRKTKITHIQMYPSEAYEAYDETKKSLPDNAIAICKKDGVYYATIGQQGWQKLHLAQDPIIGRNWPKILDSCHKTMLAQEDPNAALSSYHYFVDELVSKVSIHDHYLNVTQKDWNEYYKYVSHWNHEHKGPNVISSSSKQPLALRTYMILSAYNMLYYSEDQDKINEVLTEHKQDIVSLDHDISLANSPTLTGIDFSGTILPEKIKGIKFEDCKFNNCSLMYNAEITNCSFKNVEFNNSILSAIKMMNCSFDTVQFRNTNLTNASIANNKAYLDRKSVEDYLSFLHSSIVNCVCKGLEIIGYSFNKSQIINSDLTEARLRGSIKETIIHNCNTAGLDLSAAAIEQSSEHGFDRCYGMPKKSEVVTKLREWPANKPDRAPLFSATKEIAQSLVVDDRSVSAEELKQGIVPPHARNRLSAHAVNKQYNAGLQQDELTRTEQPLKTELLLRRYRSKKIDHSNGRTEHYR